MQEHQIKVERTARFYTLGNLTEKTKTIWFVLHGYGQLAKYFMQKFKQLADDETFVVAPEAISRFYLDAKYDRVGASWMTKDMRESEAEEYVAYLDSIYDILLKDRDLSSIKVNLLGFSQGCATVGRWLNAGKPKCNNLIFWAGFFSNGIKEVIEPQKLHGINTFYIYGDKDEFLLSYPEISQKFRDDLVKEINPRIISFHGSHAVHEATLLALAKEIK